MRGFAGQSQGSCAEVQSLLQEGSSADQLKDKFQAEVLDLSEVAISQGQDLGLAICTRSVEALGRQITDASRIITSRVQGNNEAALAHLHLFEKVGAGFASTCYGLPGIHPAVIESRGIVRRCLREQTHQPVLALLVTTFLEQLMKALHAAVRESQGCAGAEQLNEHLGMLAAYHRGAGKENMPHEGAWDSCSSD